MANGKRGRLGTSLAQKKQAKRYQPERNGNPPVPGPKGTVKKPYGWQKKAHKYAVSHWDEVVPMLVEMGLVTPIDQSQLAMMCEWYAIYKKMLENGGEARITDLQRAYKCYSEIAVRFGMSPRDRQRLREYTPAENTDEFDDFESDLSVVG